MPETPSAGEQLTPDEAHQFARWLIDWRHFNSVQSAVSPITENDVARYLAMIDGSARRQEREECARIADQSAAKDRAMSTALDASGCDGDAQLDITEVNEDCALTAESIARDIRARGGCS